MMVAACALTLSLLLLGPSGLYADKAGTVALAVRGERLTLRADDASLAVILQQLAEAAGITIYLEGPVKERVRVELVNVGFEEGMRHLLRHRNTIFLYAKSTGMPSAIYVLGLRDGAVAPQITRPVEAQLMPSEPMEDGEIDVEVERLKTSLKIGDLEDMLRTASVAESSETSSLLQDLMADPEQSVRITALQWLAERGDTGVDALATALSDGDDLVQRVAMQIILDRGVDEQAVEEVTVAAEAEDQRAVRHMLNALFVQ